MSSKLQSKDGENTLLRKENEQLQKDLKNELFNVSTAEKKLKKITEEYEKQRATLKNAKQEEKVFIKTLTQFDVRVIFCKSCFRI